MLISENGESVLRTLKMTHRILMSGEKGGRPSSGGNPGEEEGVVIHHRGERMTFYPLPQSGHCLIQALQPHCQVGDPLALNRWGRTAPEAGACSGHPVGK